MQRIFSRFLILAVLFGPVLFPSVAAAQINDVPSSDTVLGDVSSRGSGSLGGGPAGNVSCFDYYDFGSVVTNIASIVDDAIPGTAMTFTGSIANENAYPLIGLDLYVKIFRKQADDPDVRLNGHHLVAQFVAVKGLNITAQGKKDFSFQWAVPAGTIPGDYYLATYAMTSAAYNLSGLSFTNDVTGSTAPFIVRGQPGEMFAWDKNQVMMNGNPFSFAAFIPQFAKEGPVTVTAPFVNRTGEDRTIALTWKQYSWDGLRESALVDTRVETVTIPAGQAKELAFVASKYAGPVTYLVADADYLGTHSILDMRFARQGIEEARINFPSLTAFPLRKDQPAAMFSCLHTVGPNTLGGGKLDLVLTDGEGAVIAQDTYEGAITGAMMGVKYDFSPQKNYDVATLTATLSRNGVIEDMGMVTYDCRDIDPAQCPSNAAPQTPPTRAGTAVLSGKVLGLLMLLIGLIATGVWVFFKKRRRIPPVAILILALLSGWGIAGEPRAAQADTTSWTSGTMSGYEMLAHPKCEWNCYDADAAQDRVNRGPITPSESSLYRNGGGTGDGKWLFQLYPVARVSGISATVNYTVDAKKGGTKLTNGVSVLNVGDTITFAPVFTGEDISWVGTGSFNDSPFGQWGVDGQHGCREADRIYSEVGDPLFGDTKVFTSLQIPQPAVSLRNISGLSCVGLSCTVTGSSVSATVVYAPTSGKMYGATSKTKTPNSLNSYYDGGCTSVATPLIDYAKSAAYAACMGDYNENNDIACYNNASNMELRVNVPEKTIPFTFTAVSPSLIMTGAKHIASDSSLWHRFLAFLRPHITETANASGGTVSITLGDAVDLTWTTTNVDQCTLTGPMPSYTVPPGDIAAGTRTVSGLSVGSHTLTMTCSNPAIRASSANDDVVDQVRVDVGSVPTYTITFNPNGGSGTMANQSIASGATKALNTNTFTRTGYAFSGWATSSSGPVAYTNGANYTMGSANVTLYAKWTLTLQSSGLTVTPQGCGQYGLTVSWNSVVGATWYGISRDGGAWTNKGNITSFLDGPLTPGSTYSYRVQAHNSGSNGPIFPAGGGTVDGTVASACGGPTYTITSSAGAGGTIAPNGRVDNIPSGSNRTYNITADTGYAINNVVVDGTSLGALSSYTFSNITADHTISVSFTLSGGPTVDGVCGSAVSTCASGDLFELIDSGTQYLWACSGSGTPPGAFVYCAKDKDVGPGGVCGVVNADTCSSGTYVDAPDTDDYYHWTCLPMVSDGNCYMAKPKLHICPTTATVAVGGTQQFWAYYTPLGTLWSGSCALPNGTDVANDSNTTWSQLSFDPPHTSITSPGGLLTGLVPGTDVVDARYDPPGGMYDSVFDRNWNILVTCLPYINCSTAPHDARAANTCPDQSFVIDDGCGGTVTCIGTRTCDFNWKEVGQ